MSKMKLKACKSAVELTKIILEANPAVLIKNKEHGALTAADVSEFIMQLSEQLELQLEACVAQ